MRIVAGLAASLLSAGCFSYATMHTATPVPSGEREVSFGAGVLGGVNGAQGADPHDQQTIGLLGARHGLASNLDLGLRLNGLGAAGDLNWAPINSTHFALSLSTELSAVFQTPEGVSTNGALMTPEVANHYAGRLLVLADVVKFDDVTVTLGGGPGYMIATGANFVGTTGPQMKGSVGLRWEVPTGRHPGLKPILTPSLEAVVPMDGPALERPTVGYAAIFGVTTRL